MGREEGGRVDGLQRPRVARESEARIQPSRSGAGALAMEWGMDEASVPEHLFRCFSGRALQPFDCFPGIFRLRTVRQDLQISFVLSAGLVRPIQLLQANRKLKRRNRVVVFVVQRLAITVLGGVIVLALEVEI